MTEVVTIGNATLYHGDCLEILPTLPKADAIVTDPPYMFSTASAGAGKLNPWADISNAAYWYSALLRQFRARLHGDGVVWQFCNWRTLPTLIKAAFDAEWSIESTAVWDKQWIGPGGPRGLRPSYEMVALFVDGDGLPGRGTADIFREPTSSFKPSGHPAEKPVGIKRQLIEISPGGLVIDAFMGSGTTGVACRQLDRPFIGIELDERWFNVACERIDNAQRQQPMFAQDANAAA